MTRCPRCGIEIGTTSGSLDLLARAESAESENAELRAVIARVREVLTWKHSAVYDLREDILAQLPAITAPTSEEGDDGNEA